MKSVKSLSVMMVLALVLSLVAGCSKGGKEEASSSASDSPKPSASASSSASASPSAEETPAWQTEKITLKYASWEDEKMEKAMLDAFMEKYPNITVEKDKAINWPWTDALTNAASANNLPDVFWLENVPVGVQNDWLLDLSELWDNDPDSASVYPNVAKTAVYGGKRLASPTFQSIMGVYVNKKLFEKANVPLPSYDWTIDQMVDLAKKLSNPKESIFGIGGPWGNLSFNEHWPMANDETIGYNTFDGEKFHFTNQDWIDGYNQKLELRRLKIEEHMTGEEKKKVFGDENAWPTQKGNVAMAIDGSWNAGWLPDELKKTGAGEMDFYPYPGGKAGQRMPVILDYIGVSSTTKHPEAAYALMKWMAWGKDGWLKRVELYQSLGMNLDKFPVADYQEVWSALDPLIKLEGMKAAVKLLNKAVPDFNKTLPGWQDFNVWMNDEQKISEKIEKGEFTPADKAKELEDKANEFVAQATAKLNS